MDIIDRIDGGGLYKGGVAQEDNDFELTHDQRGAIERICEWWRDRQSSPAWKGYFVLAGAAGTGKSSLIQYIVRNLRLSEADVLCCAYTGKATLNMMRKGNTSRTLHSSIYDCHIRKGQPPYFTRKAAIYYRLIIVDEASMISETMFDDILSFNIPAIFIGDHCQLPPIDSDFNIMSRPDFVLTEIMRQASKSPIIRASQLAIAGKPIPYCDFDGFRKVRASQVQDSDLLWADQIVVGTNVVRHELNAYCREIRGITGGTPRANERMIVVRNNPRWNVVNGQIIYLADAPTWMKSQRWWHCRWLDEMEMSDPSLIFAARMKDLDFRVCEPPADNAYDCVYVDYGYAISCHKSQGSGWERVMVFDEGFGRDEETQRRWLYTAITRAKKEILVVDMRK